MTTKEINLKNKIIKVKVFSFIIACFISIFGYFDYQYEIFNFGYDSTANEFVVQIYFLLQALYRFGDFFNWLSFYIFPSLKAPIAFIIGQILFFPILWIGIYFGLKIIFMIKDNSHQN